VAQQRAGEHKKARNLTSTSPITSTGAKLDCIWQLGLHIALCKHDQIQASIRLKHQRNASGVI
jgi:hypothetical protein